jgi:PKD domain
LTCSFPASITVGSDTYTLDAQPCGAGITLPTSNPPVPSTTVTGAYTLQVASNVAPVIAWTANPSSVDEGQTKTYSFSISDSDSSSWTFASGYPACGTGGSISGTPSINDAAMTGTFDCFFPDGHANPTVRVKVSDGTDASNELSQPVDVANVKPTPSIDSLSGNSGVACIGGNTVTLGFSWTDPAGAYDIYSYDIDWGDGTTHATGSGAASPATSLKHTYAAGGPYTIVVTVNDEDPGAGTSATSGSFSFLYNVTGVLQPVNNTQAQQDPSIFKYGSTIPVKIEVIDCSGTPVSGLSPKIAVTKTSGSTPLTGDPEAISSTSGADTGTTMRWSDPLYIYNLATKSLADSSATYQITITGPFAPVTALFGTRAK